MTVITTKATTRGSSSKVVKIDTPLKVIATRLDLDGLKLLVAVGKGTGNRFQVGANDTDYYKQKEAEDRRVSLLNKFLKQEGKPPYSYKKEEV